MKRPLLSELTLKQKISQLLMVNQITLIYKDDNTLRTDEEIKELMAKYQYGSLWNTGNIKSKNANMAEENDLIIYAAYVAMHRPMGLPSLYGEKMETYFNAFSFGKDKSIGVSMGYPYLCHDVMAGADMLFNIYSTNPEAQKAFVKAVYGEIEPTTKSPVDLELKPRLVYC